MSLLECHEFEQRIQQILDDRGSLSGDDELDGHAAWCSECRELLREYRGLASRVTAARSAHGSVLPGSVLPGSVPPVRSVAAESPPVARSVAIRHGWLALAATLVLGLSFGLRYAGPGSAGPYLAGWDWSSFPTASSAPGAYFPGRPQGWPAAPERAASPGSAAIATQAQQLLETIEEIPATLGDIRLGELQPYYVYTASLPGVSTLTTPVRLTVDMLRRHWSPQPKTELPSRSERQEWLLQSLRIA